MSVAASTIPLSVGHRSAFIESAKWVGLALMLLHHWHFFVLGVLPLWVGTLGTFVFPLFSVAFAFALAHSDADHLRDVSLRLVLAFLVAFALQLLVRDALPVNVLLTFAASLFAFSAYVAGRFVVVSFLVACVVGFFAEYSFVGVVFQYALLVAVRDRSVVAALVGVAMLFPQGFFQYLNFWGLASPLLALLLWRFPFPVPRVRGLFLVVYCVQWPFFWFAGRLLA